ncbi:MAG TPA: hypothetical protein VGQ20_04335 [Acidimicrobiales bacterium]|nr:hypothetical protein [Acidimicrobiales bacterium]
MGATVIVSGALANKPGNGGEAWVRLSWLRGLAQLGFDAWFVEELAAPAEGFDDAAISNAAAWFTSVLAPFGYSERAVLLNDGHVLTRTDAVQDLDDVRDLIRSAALVVDISGCLRRADLLDLARVSAYVDLDPGHTQIWHAQGAPLFLDRYRLHFTVGERVGTPECTLPTGGLSWLPCRQPVVLDDWPAIPRPPTVAFTTVTTWRCPFGTAEWQGQADPAKHHEFRSLMDLPSRVEAPLEVAVAMYEADGADRDRLVAGGWRVRDASDVACTPARFRAFVQRSWGELSAAQGVYAYTRSGWFSDRSARYLATGRPVVVQDTGIVDQIPTGDGLLTFTDVDGAAAAIRTVLADPDRHARAARHIAETHFAAPVVLGPFVERCGVAP